MIKLFTRKWDLPNPKAVCLLLHGLAEHSGRHETLAQDLARRNFAVWAMDHRGHGRSEGPRGDCRSIQDFVEDLHRVVEEVRAATPRLARILIGHSLGGLIAVEYAVLHPDSVKAVAISSPAFKLAKEPPGIKIYLAKGLSRLLPATPIPNGVNPRYLSRDPQVVEQYEKDPLVHRVLTARCAVALRAAMAEVPRLARELRVPCLVLQAGSDSICDPEAAAEFSRQARAAPATFRRYEGFYHELFNEPERARVVEELCAWIEGVLKS